MKILKAALITLSYLATSPTAHVAAKAMDTSCLADLEQLPYVSPKMFLKGEVVPVIADDTALMEVTGCCSSTPIGSMPQMSTEQSIQVLEDAKAGWNKGKGEWPQMTLSERITAIENFIEELKKSRDEIIKVLMYEIGKNLKDAESEFDRTIVFIQETIKTIQTLPDFDSDFKTVASTKVMIRRNAFGIVLALGPYNYPLNETYATIIPALLMGNVVILKIPQVGGLAHLLTFEAFSKSLPKNTIHFISGGGRKTLPPLMESGDIDGLAFIGGTNAADKLIKQHPSPHRLKLFLQLEAKNMAIVMKDMVDENAIFNDSHYSQAKMFDEIITGSLSYNGQRCTALKIVFVPKGYGEFVAKELSARVDNLGKGMPWEEHGTKYSQITPLPNQARVTYMKELLDDAVSKGAVVANANGGEILSEKYEKPFDSTTLMIPAVLYNITPDMKLFREEQFGPLVPVVEYESIDDVLSYGMNGIYGQQVAIFTNESTTDTVSVVDTFSTIFGKINLNSSCARSPDSVPFTARRSSGLGIMSIEDALKEFSVPTVFAYKHDGSKELVDSISENSSFMQPL